MRKCVLLLPGMVILLVACNPSGSGDPETARRLLPNIIGYEARDMESLVDVITIAGGGVALDPENIPAAGVILEIENVVQCLRERGAVAANIYLESPASSVLPKAGVAVVINQAALVANLMDCALAESEPDQPGAQAAVFQPCLGSGSFSYRDDSITYLYVASEADLCATFQAHFDAIRANNL